MSSIMATFGESLWGYSCFQMAARGGYRSFLRAFNLRDLVDLHPVPAEIYSYFHGAARSRIDTVPCHMDATIAVASYHYWGSTLLSDHHVSLLFTPTHPVV